MPLEIADCKEEQGKVHARNRGLQAEQGWRSYESQERRGRTDETSETGSIAVAKEERENWKHYQG